MRVDDRFDRHPRRAATRGTGDRNRDDGGLDARTAGDHNRGSAAPGTANSIPLPFPGLKQPGGVAVDGDGAVYVTDFANDQVLKLAPGARSPTVLPFAGLDHPGDVAVDDQGNVYVDDELNFRVLKLPVL